MKVKRKGNPFAICRAMQKKRSWTERKYEKCVLEVKRKK